MRLFKYEPYYMFEGPTLSHPFLSELSEEQAKENLESFFRDVEDEFQDIEATVRRLEDNILEVTADISQDDSDKRVERCLIKFELVSKRATAVDLEENPNAVPS